MITTGWLPKANRFKVQVILVCVLVKTWQFSVPTFTLTLEASVLKFCPLMVSKVFGSLNEFGVMDDIFGVIDAA